MASQKLSARETASKKRGKPKQYTATAKAAAAPSKRKADQLSSEPPAKKRSTQDKKRAEISRPEINKAPTQVLNVLVFGEGENAELGLGPNRTESKVPRLNPFLDAKDAGSFRIVQLACGGMHTVALTAENKIVTWGVNDAGALGRPTEWEGGLREISDEEDEEGDGDDETGDLNPLESTPTEVVSTGFEGGVCFVQVVAGDNCSFALTTVGTVYGWGTFRNAQGDECFGFDSQGKKVKRQDVPVLIHAVKDIVQLACGTNHVLALDKHGSIWGWGINDEYQLGRRLFSRGHQSSYVPQQIRVCRGKVKYIASGQCHSFAVDQSDNVWAWGRNSNCEAGYYSPASASDRSLLHPVKIQSLGKTGVTHLAGGGNHSCAVTADGRCFAWGKMDSGQLGIDFSAAQLGDATLIRRGIRDRPEVCTRPTLVNGVGRVKDAACGTDHTIFVNSEGKAYATGFGLQGQLGLGSDDDVSVAQLMTAKSVRERKITWAGAGGGFSIVAEVAE